MQQLLTLAKKSQELLWNGKCTAELSKDFNDGYLMRLSAAYQHFVKGPDGTLQAHKASGDARMTGPLFLEIYGWKINNKPNETMEKEVPEDESGAIGADPAELSHEDDKLKAHRWGQHHRLQGPFRVQRHRRGCQHESSSIEDENSHQRHPKDGGRSRSQRIQLGTPWHVSRGVKDLAPRLRDACNGIFPSDANRVALGGGAKLRSCDHKKYKSFEPLIL